MRAIKEEYNGNSKARFMKRMQSMQKTQVPKLVDTTDIETHEMKLVENTSQIVKITQPDADAPLETQENEQLNDTKVVDHQRFASEERGTGIDECISGPDSPVKLKGIGKY